jgi:hypothetical protein
MRDGHRLLTLMSGGIGNTLKQGFAAYGGAWYDFNGSGNDSSGNANTLTEVGGPLSYNVSGGKPDRWVEIDAFTSQYLYRADDSDLRFGAGEWTAGIWFNLAATGANQALFCKDWVASNREIAVYYNNATGRIMVEAYDGGTTSRGAVSPADVVSTGTWYHLFVWHDPTTGANGTVYAAIDNGTAASVALTGAKGSGGADFSIGARRRPSGGGSTDLFYTGGVDGFFIQQRLFSNAERAYIFNSGNGRSYNQL